MLLFSAGSNNLNQRLAVRIIWLDPCRGCWGRRCTMKLIFSPFIFFALYIQFLLNDIPPKGVVLLIGRWPTAILNFFRTSIRDRGMSGAYRYRNRYDLCLGMQDTESISSFSRLRMHMHITLCRAWDSDRNRNRNSIGGEAKRGAGNIKGGANMLVYLSIDWRGVTGYVMYILPPSPMWYLCSSVKQDGDMYVLMHYLRRLCPTSM